MFALVNAYSLLKVTPGNFPADSLTSLEIIASLEVLTAPANYGTLEAVSALKPSEGTMMKC